MSDAALTNEPVPAVPESATRRRDFLGDLFTKTIQLFLAIVAQGMLLLALLLSYYKGSDQTQTMIMGAILSNSTMVFGYWLGSSAGSAKKTDQLAQQPPKP